MTDAHTPAPPAAGASAWPQGRCVGRQAFQDWVASGLQQAALHACPLVWLCDPDFVAWPLGERRLVQALDDWAIATRAHPLAQLRVLGQRFDDMRLRHARFVDWRSRWSHRVEVRVWSAGQAALPSVVWTPQWTLQRVDDVRDVAVATTEAAQRTRLDEALQQHWHQGRPGFPVTSLGL
jgi:hypothetical protein